VSTVACETDGADDMLRANTARATQPSAPKALPKIGAQRVLKADFRHFGTGRTRSYGVDAAFMQIKRRGCGIHALSRGLGRDDGQSPVVTGIFRQSRSTMDRIRATVRLPMIKD